MNKQIVSSGFDVKKKIPTNTMTITMNINYVNVEWICEYVEDIFN